MLALALVAAAAVAVVTTRPGAAGTGRAGWGRWIGLGALTLLGASAAFWLLVTAGGVVGGPRGAIHVAPALAAAGLALPAKRRPVTAGDVLTALGVATALYFLAAAEGSWALRLQLALLGSAPVLLSGLWIKLSAHDGSRPERYARTGGSVAATAR